MRDGMQGMPSFFAGSLDQDFVHARRDRRQEIAVGRGADAFFGAGDADEAFGLVVIRRDLVVGDGPVRAQAVAVYGLKS